MAVSEFVRGSTLALPAQQCNRFGVSRKRIDVVRDERPRHCRASEQRDELAPLHSITSLARASSVGGTVRPSAVAAFALMTNSNFVGCCTGRSAGLAPFRMRTT